MTHRLLVVSLVLSSCAGAPRPMFEPSVDALLALLGVRPDAVTIRGDYMMDPDRLSLTQSLLAQPLLADAEVERIRDRLSEGDPRAVVDFVRGVLPQRSADEADATCVDLLSLLHPDRNLDQPEVDSLLTLGRRVDMRKALNQADSLLVLAEEIVSGSRVGEVRFGTTGRDTFRVPASVIVDPGGDDVYDDMLFSHGGSVLVVDRGGNDLYVGRIAQARAGAVVVLDLAGDDRYAGEDGTIGSGMGGVGIVWDRQGNDTYRSEVGGIGFGLFGVGIVVDDEGDDAYVSSYLGQGAAGPGGVGVLVDRSGHDRYEAGGRVIDPREDGRYTQSFAQGCAMGLRYSASGGLGLLLEQAGNDVYDVVYFGQGSAHWAGTGMLIDESGNDTYRARRYAQGSGTHLSGGILADFSGDDLYSIDGVGQGTGHNLSVGVLIDGGGSDRYAGRSLCQGAGNANGIGVLDDRAGDDRYEAESQSQGYGTHLRGYGSIGLLIDRAGADSYSGRGREHTIWRSGSGGGVDR